MPVLQIRELISQMKKQADELACSNLDKELSLGQSGRPVATFSSHRSEAVISAGHQRAAGVFMDIKFCQLSTKD